MEKPAMYGGTPVRRDALPYGRQWIGDEDVAAVSEVLRSDYLTCGPKITELEKALCSHTGAKYAAVVSSGTAALHCACLAAGVGPGDEVITTPLTFAASANCVLYCGGRPVFADVDSETWNISPAAVEQAVTPRTKAVIAVDYTGQAVAHEQLLDICRRRHLLLIEDAAHAIGTKYAGTPVGSLADLTCFSFHPVKTVTAGEGGAVLTQREDFYQKLLLARSHGITREPEQMEAPLEGPWSYEQISLGYNYRLTDIQATLLLCQLQKLERFKARRREISAVYDRAFSGVPGLILQKTIPASDTCRHLYILRLDTERLRCTRREFFDALWAEGIHCQVHYIPVYWFPYYRRLGYEKGLCPVAEEIYQGIMSIPLYPKMSDGDVEDVITAVRKITSWFLK